MKTEQFWKREQKQILIFRVGAEELGLDISCVREVLRAQEICRIPGAPDFIEGVISLRGHLIVLMDLKQRLRIRPVEAGPDGRIIICKVGRFIVGLLVAGLREIVALAEDDLRPAPELAWGETEGRFFSGLARVDGKIIPILDLNPIVTGKQRSGGSGHRG